MTMSHWEVAAAAKLRCVESRLVLHPSKLTPRVRNAVRHMLQTGITFGGGEAANVARAIAKPLGYGMRHVWRVNYFQLDGGEPKELREKIIELMQADHAAYVLVHAPANNYAAQRLDQALKLIRSGAAYAGYTFSDKKIAKHAWEIVTLASKPNPRAQLALAHLDNNTPVVIKE